MEISDPELAWLAGLLEGEGSFLVYRCHTGGKEYRYPKIVVNMTDRDVIEHVARIFGNKIYALPPDKRRPANKPMYRAGTSGQGAVELMRAMLPWLGQRRSAKIKELLEEHNMKEPTAIRRSRTCSESQLKRWRKQRGDV